MEKSTNLNKTVLKTIMKVTQLEVEKNVQKRPPFCCGIYHQPKRPM